MAGGIFSKYFLENVKETKTIKIVTIVLACLSFIFACIFAWKRLWINYANIYPYDRTNGIENSLFYSTISIGLAILFVYLCFCLKLKPKKKKHFFALIIVGVVLCLGILIVSIFSNLYVIENDYQSKKFDSEQSEFLPINNYSYKENSDDFYYYKEVVLGDTYWIGSCSYKDFAAENSLVDFTEDVDDSTVFLNYYYFTDDSGRRVKEFLKKKDLYDVFSESEYLDEYQDGKFTAFENECDYEFMFIDDKEVYYFTASKNKRTQYDFDEFIQLAEKFLKTIQLHKVDQLG